MTYKLHKNGVITGSLNSFCLACDVFLSSLEVAADHIETSEHKKRLQAVQYSEKFKDEHIKKFKGGYFCEFCNVLMAITSKVNLHITDDEHKHNKGILLLKNVGDDVIAFNNIIIEAKAWHGLIEGVCSLCNAEFEDEKDHRADASHSLNLILKPVQFGADNAIFRHLDDTAVQCLSCNKLLAPGRMTKHFDETEHHDLYAKRRVETNVVNQGIEIEENCQGIEAKGQRIEAKETFQGLETDDNYQQKVTNMSSASINHSQPKESKINNDPTKCVKSPTKDKTKILEFIAKYQSKGININLETETAFCKKCSKVVTFDHMEIENHIQNHSSAAAVDSDLLYPTIHDQNLNRVDINDKTTKSSDGIEKDTVKALLDKTENPASYEENNAAKEESNASNDTDTDSRCSNDSDIIPLCEYNTTQDEEAKEFAKAHKITFNGGVKQSFCRVCEVHVPASFRSMKEHVGGANHKKLAGSSAAKPKAPRNLVKQSTRVFLESTYEVEALFYTASIINEEFCIPKNSFNFILTIGARMRCILCEVNLPPNSDYEDHCRRHMCKWLEVPVITSEQNEIIREVRPGLLHCGYCNLVVSGWADMKQHLDCTDHRQNRSVWEARLRSQLPNLRRYKMEKEMERMVLMSFMNMAFHR